MKSAIYRLALGALQLSAMVRIGWTLGDVIVKLRKQRRWGRQKLASHAHVSYMTVTRLETGREMKEASIRKVAEAFGLTQSELYALVPTGEDADATVRELQRLWKGLPPDSRPKVLDVLRSYAPAPPEGDLQPAPLLTPAPEVRAAQKHRGRKQG